MIEIKNKNCEIYLNKNTWELKENKNNFFILNQKSNISNSILDMNCININFNKEKDCFISTDSINSTPLFYSIIKNKYIISDSTEILINKIEKIKINFQAYTEIICLKHTLGNKTLYNEIKMIESCSKVNFSYKVEVQRKVIFKKKYSENKKNQDFYKILDEIFSDCFSNISGKIVIPLSGGKDSRLIALMVKEKLKDKKVICYTYGKSYSEEVKVSQEVAKKLDFEWHFVKYKKNFIKKEIYSKSFKSALIHNFNLSMTPHMRDYFAVKYLIGKKIISKKDTIIPGHSLDLLTGSRAENKNERFNIFSFLSLNSIRKPKSNVKKEVTNLFNKYNNKNLQVQETLDFLERQPKFIINSLRVYDYFELNWKIPFWDIRMINFWNNISHGLRVKQKYYIELCNPLFEKYDINFKEHKESSKIFQLWRLLCKILPNKLKCRLSYFIRFNLKILNLEMKNDFIEIDRREVFKQKNNRNYITATYEGVFLDMALLETKKRDRSKISNFDI